MERYNVETSILQQWALTWNSISSLSWVQQNLADVFIRDSKARFQKLEDTSDGSMVSGVWWEPHCLLTSFFDSRTVICCCLIGKGGLQASGLATYEGVESSQAQAQGVNNWESKPVCDFLHMGVRRRCGVVYVDGEGSVFMSTETMTMMYHS